MHNSTTKILTYVMPNTQNYAAILPNSNKILIYDELDQKIDKTKKHITYLTQQLQPSRNIHGGKRFRERKISRQTQILSASERLKCLETAKISIIQDSIEKLDKLTDKEYENLINLHSSKYCEKLNLSKEDLEIIYCFIQHQSSPYYKKGKNLLKFKVQDQFFKFYIKYNRVEVICTNKIFFNSKRHNHNLISPVVYQSLLNHMNKASIASLHKYLDVISSNNKALWFQLIKNSEDYQSKLNLSQEDLKIVDETIQQYSYKDFIENFITIDVDKYKFALNIQYTCGKFYGDNWKRLIQAICINKPSLNNRIGFGPLNINCVPKEWHYKILNQLNDQTSLTLRKQIDVISAKQEQFWQQAIQNSEDYCKHLNFSPEGSNSLCLEDVEEIISFRCDYPYLFDKIPFDLLHLEIDERQFSFSIQNNWIGYKLVKMIQVSCENDDSLNLKMGYLNCIPIEWHQRILSKIDDDNINEWLVTELSNISTALQAIAETDLDEYVSDNEESEFDNEEILRLIKTIRLLGLTRV